MSTSKAHFLSRCSILQSKDAQRKGRVQDNGKNDIRNKSQHKPGFPQS